MGMAIPLSLKKINTDNFLKHRAAEKVWDERS
jgi:hypothetical protein